MHLTFLFKLIFPCKQSSILHAELCYVLRVYSCPNICCLNNKRMQLIFSGNHNYRLWWSSVIDLQKKKFPKLEIVWKFFLCNSWFWFFFILSSRGEIIYTFFTRKYYFFVYNLESFLLWLSNVYSCVVIYDWALRRMTCSIFNHHLIFILYP